jgi:hypothetical protein
LANDSGSSGTYDLSGGTLAAEFENVGDIGTGVLTVKVAGREFHLAL